MPLDQTHKVLGFTGSIGSGCTYISEVIADAKEYHYRYYKLSDAIRDHLKEQGNCKEDVKLLQDTGNELRRNIGSMYLVEKTFKKIEEDVEKEGADIKGVILDGIKNEGEVQGLKMLPNFFLFSVHADKEIRI